MEQSSEKVRSLTRDTSFPHIITSTSTRPPEYLTQDPVCGPIVEKGQAIEVRPNIFMKQLRDIEITDRYTNKGQTNAVERYSDRTKIFQDVLRILVEETGADVSEFTDDARLADLGIDSLLSLTLASRFEDELQLNLLSNTSLYTDFRTVGELTNYVQSLTESIPDMETERNSGLIKIPTVEISSHPNSSESSLYTDSKGTAIDALPHCPSATSTILQGQFNLEADTLFIFPDGGGSAASYAQIGQISPSVCVIGFNSPFYKEPENLSLVSFDSLIDAYIKELRRRRPRGPYHLAGWSSGGILAYRAAQQLIREGNDVLSLALIDAPPPEGLDRLPQRWYDHCESSGIFSPVNVMDMQRVLKHFEATIDVLQDYTAEPLPPGFCPKVSIAWAGECVFDGVHYPRFPTRIDDPLGIKFLTEKRKDRTAGRWQQFFPGEKVSVEVFEKENHFSMVRGECGEKMARFLKKVLL